MLFKRLLFITNIAKTCKKLLIILIQVKYIYVTVYRYNTVQYVNINMQLKLSCYSFFFVHLVLNDPPPPCRFQAGKLLLLMTVASWILFTLPVGFIHPPVVSCKFWNGSTYLLQEPGYTSS